MDESKVIWLTCPDCGSKIGIIVSVGKAITAAKQKPEEMGAWPPATNFEEKLKETGVDTSLLTITESEEVITVSPKKFLGDLWGQYNDTLKSMGGVWIREGRESRWEIHKVLDQS